MQALVSPWSKVTIHAEQPLWMQLQAPSVCLREHRSSGQSYQITDALEKRASSKREPPGALLPGAISKVPVKPALLLASGLATSDQWSGDGERSRVWPVRRAATR